MMTDAEKTRDTCNAQTAGYDGMFGVYCELPHGHSGLHNDGWVEWDYVDPELRNSTTPAITEVFTPEQLRLLQAALTTPTCWNPRIRDEALRLVERAMWAQQFPLFEAASTETDEGA